MNFFEEVWNGYRPYLVKLTIDFLVCGSLWLVLFIFKFLTTLITVPVWAGVLVVNLHSAGVVAVIFILIWLFVNDVAQTHRGNVDDSSRQTE